MNQPQYIQLQPSHAIIAEGKLQAVKELKAELAAANIPSQILSKDSCTKSS